MRLSILVGTILTVAFAAAVLRIRGVTGDLVPIVEWRWKRPPALARENTAPVRTLDSRAASHRYPQFLGPDRTGHLPGPALERDWASHPPEILWRQPIGAAWSGFAVESYFAVTQEQRGDEELVVCYDLLSGRVIWMHADRARYATTIAGEGPRATPTIHQGIVYTVGATGILNALEVATGKRRWSKNIIEDNQGKVSDWGISCSPLVWTNWVIVTPDGPKERSLVAYDRDSGERVWSAGNDRASYSSPCLVTLLGTRQILSFNSGSVAGHDASSGALWWEYPWPRSHPHITLPLVLPGTDEYVLISSGYGTGAALLKITREQDRWTAKPIWRSNRLKSKFANVIAKDGFLYGLDDGILVCLDSSDGQLRWKEGRYGHGQMILVGDLLLVLSEHGEVVLIEPKSERLAELGRFPVFKDKTWNPPALAGEYLMVRNDKEAACLRLKLAE